MNTAADHHEWMCVPGGLRVILLVSLCIGCVYQPVIRTEVQREPRSSELRLRTDQLPGRGELTASGAVRFAIDLDRLCQRFGQANETTIPYRSSKLTKWFWIYLAGFAAGAATGGYLLATADSSENQAAVGAILLGEFGLFGTIGGILIPVLGSMESKEEPSAPRVVTLPTTNTRCDAGVAPAKTLTLTTPWGVTIEATPAPDGVATFAIDWTDDRIAADAASQLHSPWRIASRAGPATHWTMATSDRNLALELIARTRDRVITGSTPPVLIATLTAGATGVVVGGTSVLALRVENRGTSTAIDVTARTRSSVAVLHGLIFDLGKIQPGKAVVRSVTVKLPEATAGDDATVLVTFQERNGHAPVELTKKLPLVRSLCPSGKLTRTQYDERRARLKRTLDAGDLSPDDFDRYDAELLRCLE
jgi:hypothetical protein